MIVIPFQLSLLLEVLPLFHIPHAQYKNSGSSSSSSSSSTSFVICLEITCNLIPIMK